MARKQEDTEAPDEEAEEGQGAEDEETTTSIDITESTIVITVPRDGNEGDTLSRLSGLVDGLGQ
jgi:hypothetical protein